MVTSISIRTKLTLYAVVATLGGVSVSTAMVVFGLAQRRDAIHPVLEMRSADLRNVIDCEQPQVSKSMIDLFASDPTLRRVGIFSRRPPAEYFSPDAPVDVRPFELGYRADMLRLVSRCGENTQIILWYDNKTVSNELIRAGLQLAVAMLGAVLTAILFASLASRWVARPIAEFAALARSIPESGDYQVGPVRVSRDEIGQLGAAFEEMLNKIERRERALDEARATAEEAAANARAMAAQSQAAADALAKETEARETAQRQLEQAQKMEALGRLAGGVAHDFNNLLFVISTYADELTKRLKGEEYEAVDQIQEAARRAINLTQQLLSFTREPSGKPTDVDVGRMLSRMQALLQRLIGEDIELTVTGVDQRIVVRAPDGALESAVMNLVVNARDAMPSGGSIDISMCLDPDLSRFPQASASKEERWMVLSIHDDGDGMDEQTQHQAFEPFFTTKPTGEGTGLGLTLVYALCRQLGGQVTVHSVLGKGTSFDLLLPVAEGEMPRIATELPSLTPLPSEEGRVLVAEDNPQVRRLLTRVLTMAGFEVEAVSDGDAALHRLREAPPVDIVVSDVVMPKMGGLDLRQALRREGIEVPMLFISGYPAHPGQSSAPFPPELPLLRKPFNAQALRRLVRRMLGRSQDTPPPFDATDSQKVSRS
ncbi:MAG: ATP-binding protein [Myxococcota bacterium]